MQYQDCDEILNLEGVCLLVNISPVYMKRYLFTGKTPMGAIKEGYHYFKVGTHYRFPKDRICELFGILPKTIVYVEKNDKAS